MLNDAKQVFASRYQLTLPTAEELERALMAERRRLEAKLDDMTDPEDIL